MLKQLLQLVKINLLVFFREPGALFWSFVFPIGMAWVLGIAFTNEPEKSHNLYLVNPPQAWLNAYNMSQFDEIKLGDSLGLKCKAKIIFASIDETNQALKKGNCILYIDFKGGNPAFHYDPSNTDAVNFYLLLERKLIGRDQEVTVQKITTKGTRYIDFLLPGLFALGIMNSCVWGVSWYLIEFRMKKLLRRVVATPLKKSVFVLSHVIARLLLTMFESLILLIFGYLFFDIVITGNAAAFIILYLSGVIAFGGIGLLIGSRTESTHIGNGLINAVLLPMTLLSGIFFSYESFPEWVKMFIKLMPLTLLADSFRGLFHLGYGFAEIIIPSSMLTFIGLFLYFIGIKIFKWY